MSRVGERLRKRRKRIFLLFLIVWYLAGALTSIRAIMEVRTARGTKLWIATPYFVPDEQFVSTLQLAALRGVDVRILLPGKIDNKLVQLSGWSTWRNWSKSV